MIHRQHDQIEFECDDCAEILETFSSEWGEALRKLKREGWAARKNGDQWEHYCSKCAELH